MSRSVVKFVKDQIENVIKNSDVLLGCNYPQEIIGSQKVRGIFKSVKAIELFLKAQSQSIHEVEFCSSDARLLINSIEKIIAVSMRLPDTIPDIVSVNTRLLSEVLEHADIIYFYLSSQSKSDFMDSSYGRIHGIPEVRKVIKNHNFEHP